DIITAHVLLLPTNHSGMESWQSVHSKGLFPHPARISTSKLDRAFSEFNNLRDSLWVAPTPCA
ncbi:MULTISPECIES: hypothetical protein, partial [unclassified Rhizobium]